MKKFLFFIITVLAASQAFGQAFYNEWIDFSKTYYRFKIGGTGVFRIPTSELNSAGLGSADAANFQLWRNGRQVPLATSSASGPLAADGYIEFWGVRNDGVTDKDLYRTPDLQLSDRVSLLTDTAAFFLTVNPAGNNLRFTTTPNNVSTNTLPAEPYFTYTARHNYIDRIHRGYATPAGSEYLYSSQYDGGEMWSTLDIQPNTPYLINIGNLFAATSGPSASFRSSVAGSAPNFRQYTIELNGNTVVDTMLSQFSAVINNNPSVPLSLLASGNASIKINNKSGNINDRIVAGFVEITYPRQFNFANQSNFEFTLAPSATAKFLQIANFAAGGVPPVLYDVTNMRRYVTDIASTGFVRVVVQPSNLPANFILVSQAAGNAKVVSGMQPRTFINYNLAANQADYMVITHNSLQAPLNGVNQISAYLNYRSSANGGSFNAKSFDIDQLVDQFGYGIKKNPLSIKNFLRFARSKFSVLPKFAFLIGKGVTYSEYRENQFNPLTETLNLVPTWGYPASDVLLASDNMIPVMNTPIGRLSILYPQELADYLDKIKQYEQAQQNNNQTIDNKAWMKQFVHVVGANDDNLNFRLSSYMAGQELIIKDTLFGGTVANFNKTSTGPVTTITNRLMEELFQKGISFLQYFGHSSATSLDYNLDDPNVYNNTGKYPMFLVNGCNAGNLYAFEPSRFNNLSTLSERYVLAKNKGSIGFIASTHFGLENYLDYYSRGLYRSIGVTGYGKSIGFNINEAITNLLAIVGPNDYYGRLHAEQTTLHGDPAVKINSHAKPDFVIEEPQIKINPNIVSTADVKFGVKIYLYNIGKATGDSVRIYVKQQYPDGSSAFLFDKKIKSVRYIDSVLLEVPIVASRDRGENKIIVYLDSDFRYDELDENNNTNAKTFLILDDDLRPVYPYNFAIINRNNAKLVASTANPVAQPRQYLMELDTTELFNSNFKIVKNVTSSGGIIEFDPGVIYNDTVVYYWRVAPQPVSGPIRWNTASFVYLNASSLGYNQSHFYQHTKSGTDRIYIDSSTRQWKFSESLNRFIIVNSIYPYSGGEDNHFSIAVNGTINIASACLGHSVIFNVFDPVTLKPYFNQTVPSTVQNGAAGFFMGSAVMCHPSRLYNFEFSYKDTTGRRKMRDFMDWIPAGSIVTARLILDESSPGSYAGEPFVNEWKNDEQVYGIGNTAYARLKNAGFTTFDQYTYPRTWAFLYKKNVSAFVPQAKFSAGLTDRLTMNIDVPASDTLGQISSPKFGPAMAWKSIKWRGRSLENTAGDMPMVYVLGIRDNGIEDTLYRLNATQQDFDISAVSPIVYPNIRLFMANKDAVNLTPYQLRYWRVLYDAVPEGGLAANINYRFKDTLEVGEQIDVIIPFKNISDVAFRDSIKVNVTVFDKNNVATLLPVDRKKKLQPGDTAQLTYRVDTRTLSGNNTLLVDFNPNLDQPEQYRFNNFLYKNFFVKADNVNPLMDVTFDGVHILNGDIVSSKPKIVVKLKDESRFLALDDTTLTSVFIKYPGNNGVLKRFRFDGDTLRFISANLGTGKNEASIEFAPYFLEDSQDDFYELIVRAKDKSGNNAGAVEYRVRFQVINKPMISNMFNYPNPFTSSTAFVFTITGSAVPQNIRIQIMTVTGKIVKEITKEELGPLHIGRNITEYKWDGTDQYGGKLGNGIYLYRVITNQNGASLEKYNTVDANGDKVNTDKYFNKGYGKMYLMR